MRAVIKAAENSRLSTGVSENRQVHVRGPAEKRFRRNEGPETAQKAVMKSPNSSENSGVTRAGALRNKRHFGW
jgi:hypothetical protein